MVNKIIRGVISAIQRDLGNDASKYHYYEDAVRQDFKVPCFYPHLLSSTLTRRVGRGYEHKVALVVHYFPENPYDRTEMNGIGNFLCQALENITITTEKLGSDGAYVGEQGIRGIDIHFDINNDRVFCYATYTLLTQKQTNSADSMETLEVGEVIN